MILSMSGQAWLFLTTVAAGFIIGLVYDIFRILRKAFRHRQWAVQLEDILFWVAGALLMFYFMLQSNYGEIRFFTIMGAALGMVIYFCSLSLVVMRVASAVIDIIRRVLRFLFAPFAPPLRKFTRFLKRGSAAKIRKTKRSFLVMLKKV